MKVNYKQVESWMVDLVRRKLRDFDYHGKLDSQHYSFCRTGILYPFPVYHHLLFCYNRTARRLQLKLGCSLLFNWRLRRNPGQITHVSRMIACDLSGHSRFKSGQKKFEDDLQNLIDSFFPEFTADLVQDEMLLEGMHLLLSDGSLPKEKFSSKFISDLSLVASQGPEELGESGASAANLPKLRSQEFDAFLKDLMPEEAEVSAGSFTINAAKAGEKLQRFQLSSPQNFVVHLVGAAVAGGASWVEVYVDADDIVVEFDGTPFGKGELEELLDSMFCPHASQRQRELAVAFNAAQSLEPRFLTLETWSGQRGYRYQVQGRGVLSELASSPFAQAEEVRHRIHYRDRPSLKVVRRFLDSRNKAHYEADILRQRCHLSPITLTVLDKNCRNFPLPESSAYLLWSCPSHPIGPLALETKLGKQEESPGDFSLLLLVGPSPSLRVVVNGVDYRAPEQDGEIACWCLIVNNRLGRDLSYTGVSDDDRWAQIQPYIPQALGELTKILMKGYASTLGPGREALAKFFLALVHQGREDLLTYPIFSSLIGEYFSLSEILFLEQIRFTQRDYKYPLRSGERVFRFSEKDLVLIQESLASERQKLLNADAELESSQVYFARREQWLQIAVQDEFKLAKSYGPILKLRGERGELGLSRNLGPARLELFALGRPLKKIQCDRLPRGLKISVNDDSLQVSDDWSELVKGQEYFELISSLTKDMEKYYVSLLSLGSRYTNHILAFLIFQRKKGKNWSELFSRLQFRLLDGSSKTWEELSAEGGLAGARATWLRNVHVSSAQRSLVDQLLSR